MMPTVREFVEQSYRLISAHSPTVPLYGDDLSLGIRVLNQLLQSYASTGLMITVAKETSVSIAIDQRDITCGPADYVPTPDITLGRLANLDSAWLLLDGVTYPLIIESRNEFLAAWKYDPLKGLPRFIIVMPETDIVRLRIYPAASQVYEFFLRGKFQLNTLTSNDDMNLVPQYYHRYLLFALAKDVAMYKGRMEAWTAPLEQMYQAAKDEMVASSEVNLAIVGERDSLLNGAWAIRAGVS
jgi:hypothetical protein